MPEIIYATSGDVREELNAGMVAGDVGYRDESQIRGAVITRSMRRATRVINGYLETVYPAQIPFASTAATPVLIQTIANDISVFYVKRSMHPGPAPLSEEVKSEYWEKSIDILEKIKNREIELPELTATIDYPDTYDARSGYHPVFDMDNPESWGVDSDLLDDIADDRE